MDEHGVVTLTIREEDVMVQLRNENELLREAVADAARQVEFLTAECMAWRHIHEADQQAIEAIIKQMGGGK